MAQSDILIQQKYLTGVSSVVGDTRRQYEDRAKLSEIETGAGLQLLVAIVADGVGSADNGGLAAQLSIDSVLSYMYQSEETDIPLMISNSLKYANYVVYKDVITRDVDASTTLTVGVFHNDRFYVGNVGDSRAYWIQESGKVIQLTLDHNYYNIKGGDPKSAQAEALVNAIGIRKDVYADIGLYVQGNDRHQAAKLGTKGLPLKMGDTILLCSDGLIKDDLQGNRFVSDEEIVQALHTEIQPNAAAVKMTGLAEGRYVDDNVSVVTVQHTSPERIENVLAKQKRKNFMQKMIYAGLAFLILAGIITGAVLLNAKRKADQEINRLANQPTSTPIVHTAVATPTATAMIPVQAGNIQVMKVGHFDESLGFLDDDSSSLAYPRWSMGNSPDSMQTIPVGSEVSLSEGIYVETFSNVGVMFSMGSRNDGGIQQGNNALHTYGNSTLFVKNEPGVTNLSLSSGAIYLKMVSRSERAEIDFPYHNNAKAELIGGAGLFVLDDQSLTFWCLAEACRLDYNNESDKLMQHQVRVYQVSEGTLSAPEDYAPPSARYEEYLRWNNDCNQCLPFDEDGPISRPTPTPTPTQKPVFSTSTPEPGKPTQTALPSLIPSATKPAEPTKYTLTVRTEGQGSVSPNGGSYDAGARVTLSAKAADGWEFSGWSGDASGTSSTVTLTITKNMTVKATFTKKAPVMYTLTVATEGQGSVTPGSGSYQAGSQVTLSANPADGWEFSGWSGNASGTSNPITITMDGNKTVTATFTKKAPVIYTLTVTAGDGGSVSLNPSSGTYEEGTQVTLTASPKFGYQFSGWGGDASGFSNPLIITMDGNKTITANFTIKPPTMYRLTVSVTPSGGGFVSLSPAGGYYEAGTEVTLTASPNEGYQFSGWGGAVSGTSNPLTLIMDGNKSINANFSIVPPETPDLTARVEDDGQSLAFPSPFIQPRLKIQ